MSTITQLSLHDAYKRLQNGAILLDVREPDEVQEISCDVPEVLYIPMSEFQSQIQTLPKDKELITICYSGARSFVVTQFLVTHGYSLVFNLDGGIMAWKNEGLPCI